MKRVFGIVLALVLCVFSVSALATEATEAVGALGSDFSQEKLGVDLAGAMDLQIPLEELQEEARAGKSSDSVTNNNGVYSISTPSGMSIKFDPRGLTYFTLTQSYQASYDVYSQFKDKATAQNYINNLINDGIHVLVWDYYDAFQFILMDTFGSDDLSKAVRNLAQLSADDIHTVASYLAVSCGLDEYSLYNFNNNSWIQLGANNLFTIVNSEYAHVQYVPNGNTMTSDDYSDFTDFMRSLKLN